MPTNGVMTLDRHMEVLPTFPAIFPAAWSVEKTLREMKVEGGLFQLVMSMQQLNGAQVSAVF